MFLSRLKKKLFSKNKNKKDLKIYENILQKSSNNLTNKLNFLNNIEQLDNNFYNDLEKTLIESDVSYKTTTNIINSLKQKIKKNHNVFKIDLLIDCFIEIMTINHKNENEKIPKTLVICGINGVGKTTTIAKLANYYIYDKKIQTLVIAADTYRKGAVEQISKWCQDHELPCFVPGSIKQIDPASVIYSGLEYANTYSHDYIICDTAGRMHVNENLMNELKKIYKIVSKKNEDYAFYLVIDSTSGQNSLQQLEYFLKYIKIDGVILTKIDGMAKGGIILSICNEFNVPIKYVGTGENIGDLIPFDFETFLYNILKGLTQ